MSLANKPSSGKLGGVKINGVTVANIKNWTHKSSNDVQAYASSSTFARKARVPGVGDGEGSFEIYRRAGEALPFVEGDVVTLILYDDRSALHGIQGEAVILDIERKTEVESGALLGATVSFGEDVAANGTGFTEF